MRLAPDLSDAERERATALVRRAVAMPHWRLHNAQGYTVTGVPVLAEDLADALAASVLRLLVVAVAVMALVLALVFRSRLRLAAAGRRARRGGRDLRADGAAGAPLTMASIAVLPVLLGLGTDYAIQYQARFAPDRPPPAALATIATAALATAAGFLVLLLSPVPMVRGFGLVLVAGIGVALLFAVARRARRAGGGARARPADAGALARSQRGAARAAGAALGRGACWARALRRPGRVLAVGLLLAPAAGSPTRRPRWSRACPRSCRRTCRPCAT